MQFRREIKLSRHFAENAKLSQRFRSGGVIIPKSGDVFANVSPDLALAQAMRRDFSQRIISPEGWHGCALLYSEFTGFWPKYSFEMPSATWFVASLNADPFEHAIDLTAIDYLASVAVKLAQFTIDNANLDEWTRFKTAVGTLVGPSWPKMRALRTFLRQLDVVALLALASFPVIQFIVNNGCLKRL
jgi:hypothetical protein